MKVYFEPLQIMHQMLSEVYHFNISWARTHSLLTFGCSWMSASSQRASSRAAEAAAGQLGVGSCKTPVASHGPRLKLPPPPSGVIFCFGEHFKSFFLDTFKTGNTLVHGTIKEPGHEQGEEA